MLPLERQNKILEILAKKKAATVDELCSQLYSSGATIRRDLVILENNRLIRRTHGGAIYIDGNASEFPLNMRESENIVLKDAIARKALPYIKDGMTLFMDSSSTVCALAEKLNGFKNLRIVTNGLKTCSILSEKDGIEIFCTGGKLRKNAKSLIGSAAINSVDDFYADIAFISCRGVDAKMGFSDANEDEAELKRAYIKNSNKLILLCDSSKINKKSFCKIGDMKNVWKLISDKELDGEYNI